MMTTSSPFLRGWKVAPLAPRLAPPRGSSSLLLPSLFFPAASSLLVTLQTCHLRQFLFSGKSLRCPLYKIHKNKLFLILQTLVLPNKDLKELYKQWIKP